MALYGMRNLLHSRSTLLWPEQNLRIDTATEEVKKLALSAKRKT